MQRRAFYWEKMPKKGEMAKGRNGEGKKKTITAAQSFSVLKIKKRRKGKWTGSIRSTDGIF
jgi:hypothetical protein